MSGAPYTEEPESSGDDTGEDPTNPAVGEYPDTDPDETLGTEPDGDDPSDTPTDEDNQETTAANNPWDEQEPETPEEPTAEGPSTTGDQDSETHPPGGEVSDTEANGDSGESATETSGNVTLSTNIYSVSEAEAGALSKALKSADAADQTLNSYIQTNGDISTDVIANNSDAKIFAVKAEDAAAGDNYYVLDVDAKAADGFNLNSYDISLVMTRIDLKYLMLV